MGGGVGLLFTPGTGGDDLSVLRAPETVARRVRWGGGGGGRRRGCGDGRSPLPTEQLRKEGGWEERDVAEGDSEVEEASSVSRSIRFPSGILGGSGGLPLGGVSLARTSSPTSIGLLFLDLLLAGALPPPSPSPSPRLSSGVPRLLPSSRRESAACGADTVFLRDGLVRGEGGGGGSFGSCWYDFTDIVVELLLSVSSRRSRLRGESRIQSRHAHAAAFSASPHPVVHV